MIADDPLVAAIRPSPNRDERRGGLGPDMLILHYTGMPTFDGALARLTDPVAEVSSHYLVAEDGRVVQLVPEALRAWHAGAGSWAGEGDMNSRSIGIEIANGGHAGGLPPYPDAQIERVIALSRSILGRWPIPARRVLAHSDVAPARKEDPGELFPWGRLAKAGIGHWVEPVPIREGAGLGPDAAGPEVAVLQRDLRLLGYGLDPTAVYDEATTTIVRAFQRHHRPARVDGIADLSTRETLGRLLRAA